MEIVVTNQYGLIIFAVTVDENGMPKTLYQGINRAEAVSTYQKAIENPANAKKRVRFYNFRQVYDYVGEEKSKSAYPIKEFYDDTEVYQPLNKDNIETIMVNNNHKLLAPNGKVSNLTAEQWHLVRTPEFKDWFGDWLRHPNRSSKVLDANGEPMVMFHGSNNYQYFTNPYPNYTVFFDPRMSRLEPRTEGGGVYFSNKWDVAAQFSIFNFVVECFINIRKPIKIDGYYSHIWYVIGEERINYGKNDGVILYNTYDTLDGETDNENYLSDIVIARYSNQVKLADGRNTTFDKNDVDIRFEDGGKLHSSNIDEAKKSQKKHDAVILLAPNGKKSNLTPEQWHLVRTPAFKAWFGDWENNPQEASKVVDSNGEPLVVYHGTYLYRGYYTEFNNISYFTDNKNTAKKYPIDAYVFYETFDEYVDDFGLDETDIEELKKHDYDVVKLQSGNIMVREDDWLTIWKDYDPNKLFVYECFLNLRNPKIFENADNTDITYISDADDERIIDAKNENYDSIIGVYPYKWFSIDKTNYHRQVIGDYEKEKHFVTFYSNQIKLADGTNTTFDGSNPDIRFELGGIYHGSPYRFEKFSTSHIGTGESHRSYGWGLYFTEIEGIAKFYANNVSRPILLDKNANEIKISDELANLIKLGYEKNMMWWDTDYIKEIMGIRAKALGTKWAEDAVKELNQIGYFELVFDRYVYRVTLHKGKTPDQYTWLEWDKPVSAENIIKINKALEKKGIPATPKKYMEVGMDGRVSVGMNGEQVYIELSKIFGDAKFGGDKQASLFLLENGIDGIKYPADKNMAGGFSFVVFDENAVTIDNVEQFAKGGKTGNLNYLYKIYDDKEFVRELENLIEKDGSSFICTYVASAIKMLEGDRAKIYGFSQLENPQSQYFADIGEDEDEGHHFAVVDDRYIVDAWIFNNFSKDGKIFGRSVFDMENPNDQDIIEYVYGNKNNWTDITNRVKDEFEEFFPKSALELKEKYKAYKTKTQFNKGGKTNSSRPFSSLDISRVKKGIVQLHSIHPKRITKIDDLPI